MTAQKPGGSPIPLLLWDVGLPLAAYYGLRLAGQDERVALLAGALLAALRLGWAAVRQRSFDGFAALLATVLGVGLALSFVTGDPRFLILKESFATGAAALIMLASCASHAPLVLVAVRAGSGAAKRAEIDRLCAELPGFRRAFVRMTAVWGLALLLEAALRVPLVYLLPVDVMAGLSVALLIALVAALSAWTAWYAGRVQARAEVTSSKR
ncbi:VC0807 family protein [Qaidamihabitans albus]|uniref:VC0807 family protein n=1 Tax=Qaidamihabitans albus TaxID=2795733 RepID=UPI0018F1C910|nr:VC0807 family protein [Qaidamihabitans albus]